jgi:hypothetical protein
LEQFQSEILDPFKQMLTSTYFLFCGQYHDQKDEKAMRLPLAPSAANYFVETFGKQALGMAPKSPTYWYRYMMIHLLYGHVG